MSGVFIGKRKPSITQTYGIDIVILTLSQGTQGQHQPYAEVFEGEHHGTL